MGYTKLIAVNSDIEMLYRNAFQWFEPRPDRINSPYLLYTFASRTLWEAKDTSFYYNFGKNKMLFKDDVFPTKSFSYEFITPVEDSAQIAKFAVQELNNYFGRKFGFEGLKEDRKVMCWVLRKTAAYVPFKTKGEHLNYDFDNVNYKKLSMTNGNTNWFVVLYSGFFHPLFKTPFIDETGIKDRIDLVLESDTDMRNFESVNKALKKYGLEFIKAERKIEMIIIRDKKV